jgi:hypothetical protein
MAFLSAMVTGSAAQESASQADQTATVHGVVLSMVNQQPIPGALVTLMQNNRSVLTDDQGRFSFSAVPFGSQNVSVKKPDFLCSLSRSQERPHCFEPLDVDQSDVQVTLTMEPQAVVTGRVVDQTGAPVAEIPLRLLVSALLDGQYVWRVLGQSATQTNPEGVYRMANLEAGSYLLETASVIDAKAGPAAADQGYAATYYPGAFSRDHAKPITVRAGDEFKADLTISHEKFQPVTVSPAWNHPFKPGNPGWGVSELGSEAHLDSAWDDADRIFRLHAPAGDYKIVFSIYPPTDLTNGELVPWPDGTTKPYLGSVQFTVKDQPVTLTNIPSQQAVTIPVHVRAELSQQENWKTAATPARPYKPPAATFQLTGEDGLNDQISWRNGQGMPDLAFKDVLPGSYVIGGGILCCNAAAYIASITCGNTDLLRSPLVVGAETQPCAIEAVIRDDVAQIAFGLTPNAESQLKAAGIDVTDAALIPLDEELEPPYSAAVWRGSEPKLNMIRPGRYLAFLFDGRQIAWRDPDEGKRLMRLGTVVTIAPGESKTIQLDWLPELNDPHKQPLGVSLGQVLP